MVSLGGRPGRLLTATVASAAAAAALLPASQPASAAGPRADLTVVRTTAPGSAEVGKAFGVETDVRNAGLRRSRATSVEYYLSTNARKDSGDKRLAGSARLKALIGGVSHDVSARVKVPSGTAPGTYYVIACIVSDAGSSRNDCKAAPNKTEVTGLSGDGSIAGELTLTDIGEEVVEGELQTWERTATVGVRLDVEGESYDAEFADAGSRYTYVGQENRSTGGPCPTWWDETESGAGGFVWTGDPYTDDIYGHFGHVDRSEVTVGLFMYFDQTLSFGDCDSSHTQSGEGLNVVSIDFEEVSRTASAVTYEAVAWEGELSTESNWDEIAGTITFSLD